MKNKVCMHLVWEFFLDLTRLYKMAQMKIPVLPEELWLSLLFFECLEQENLGLDMNTIKGR